LARSFGKYFALSCARSGTWLGPFVLGCATACGASNASHGADAGGSLDGASGTSSGDAASAADAFVAAFVKPSDQALGLCPFGSRTDWLDIGTPSAMKPTTVSNGGSQRGYRVSATCTVRAAASGFDVTANAVLGGTGSITILSLPGQGVSATTGGVGLTASFESASMGQFSASNCLVTFTYGGALVPAMPPIASGQIWGHLSCPEGMDPDVNRALPDGGVAPATCDLEADFLFDGCSP
jgi:hypothetical protein